MRSRQTNNFGRETQSDRRLAYSIAETILYCGTSKTSLYGALARGDLKARKFGRRTLILKSDLEAWLASLPEFHAPDQRHED